MKQRTTYLLPAGAGLSATDIALQPADDSLRFARAGHAVEELRLTLAVGELPDELRDLLGDVHELHVRWSSERNTRLVPPLVSRVPAGLHVFFTPREAGRDVPICRFIERLLSPQKAKCDGVNEAFSKMPILSGRFAATSTWQFFQYAPIRDGIGHWILGKVCDEARLDGQALDDCRGRIANVSSASYVDIDFDAISHALTVTTVWSPFQPGRTLDAEPAARTVRKARKDDRVEVGTLQVEQSDEPEELSLGGFLTVLGENEKPGATMFSFPSRHHPLPAAARSSYKASFQQPTGLHPKLEITLSRRNLSPPKDSCALHAYLTLTSSLFIDRYQLSDSLYLASQNLIALRSLSGEEDLEAPDWIISRWGSAALLELAHPLAATGNETDLTITIPTHLRYLAGPQLPTDPPDQATVDVPWPAVFWACEAEEGLKMSNNPFDRVNLGFEGLFGPKTMFYHIPPASDAGDLVAEVKVPVLGPESAEAVRWGTAVAVVLGFGWVCWKLLGGGGRVSRMEECAEGKKGR